MKSQVVPELWLYLRGTGPWRELVCKVFDAYPGWLRTPAPGRVRRASLEATNGRGLDVVHEMSGGRWGYHLTRSRLHGVAARGKAVWFAIPAAPGGDQWQAGQWKAGQWQADPGRGLPATAGEAMRELEAGLAARGFEGELVRADDPSADMAVLSVTSGLTVWCRAGSAWMRAPGCGGERWGYADLVEVEEQAVQAYETLAEVTHVPLAGAVTRTGALTSLKPAGPR